MTTLLLNEVREACDILGLAPSTLARMAAFEGARCLEEARIGDGLALAMIAAAADRVDAELIDAAAADDEVPAR